MPPTVLICRTTVGKGSTVCLREPFCRLMLVTAPIPVQALGLRTAIVPQFGGGDFRVFKGGTTFGTVQGRLPGCTRG
jgi:guanyl-specific ribonuclease Sa